MDVVVVVAHPDPDSFNHAIAAVAVKALQDSGHVVTVVDLYEENFQTAMSLAERRAYHSGQPILDDAVARHAALVTHADALVFVYPTWWSSMPAILKGWLDRVMVPGVAFDIDEDRRITRRLTHVRRIVGISTYGSPWLYVKAMHDNGRRTLLRALRLNAAMSARSKWLALYRMDNRTVEQRATFLQRVDTTMRAL
jgi:putative NADPH-quinone reductase